jgi:hypothetical protein
MHRFGALVFVLALTLGACGPTASAEDPGGDLAGVTGKADGSGLLLSCTKRNGDDDIPVRGKWRVYDQGLAENVPWGVRPELSEVIIPGGYPVKQYRIVGDLKTSQGDYETFRYEDTQAPAGSSATYTQNVACSTAAP